MLFLGEKIAEKGIVMQLHYGAQRNTNTVMFNKLGADTGFDCISVKNCGEALTGFLNALNVKGKLPKTIIYSLNPNDNELIDTLLGCFQGTEAQGKIQHGSAWWFGDTKSGMEAQLKSLANLSLLGNFVGMLTDSRSFLSYTRHEYFRRILCNLLGEWVENGEYPDDKITLEMIVKDISYNNAKKYFNISALSAKRSCQVKTAEKRPGSSKKRLPGRFAYRVIKLLKMTRKSGFEEASPG